MAGKSTRRTPQRECIMEVLRQGQAALSAEEIWQAARKQFPNLALTTVYRNLENLTAQGLARRSMFSDGVTRFDLAPRSHGHSLICLGCNRSIPLPDCPLHALEQELMRDTGFTIQDHRLEIYGYCPECRKK